MAKKIWFSYLHCFKIYLCVQVGMELAELKKGKAGNICNRNTLFCKGLNLFNCAMSGPIEVSSQKLKNALPNSWYTDHWQWKLALLMQTERDWFLNFNLSSQQRDHRQSLLHHPNWWGSLKSTMGISSLKEMLFFQKVFPKEILSRITSL